MVVARWMNFLFLISSLVFTQSDEAISHSSTLNQTTSADSEVLKSLQVWAHSIQESFGSSMEHERLCKWLDVRAATSNVATIGKPYSSMLHTPCIGFDSLGNSFSNYIESRICALKTGLHYVGVSMTYPKGEFDEHPFFKSLEALVVHPNVTDVSRAPAKDLSAALEKACPCPSMCHEWNYGLMHSHMPFAGDVFRASVDAYWIEETRRRQDRGQYLSLTTGHIKAGHGDDKVLELSGHTSLSANVGDNINWKQLPTIPDVAVHYRCGDNVVTHYGFLPFRTFQRIIPASAKYIYVMAESASRKPRQHSVARCDAIFEALMAFLTKHFPASVVVIMRGHDIIEDLVRLTYAPLVVCSVSTYCLWPAVGNRNGTVHFPLTKLIAKEEVGPFNYGPNFAWIKDSKERVVKGVDATRMQIADLVRILSAP